MTALRYACPDCGFRLMTPRRCGGCQAKHDAEIRVPERIQLRRTKGWRKPEGVVTVARPSRWGNPFVVGSLVTVSGWEDGGLSYSSGSIPLSLDMAIALYRDLVVSRMDPCGSTHPDDLAYCQQWRDALAELRGHDLACWCPLSSACHADVLLEIANA